MAVDASATTLMGERRVLVVGNFLSRRVATRSIAEELATRLRKAGWKVETTSDKASGAHRFFDIQRTLWRQRSEFDVAQVDVFSGGAFRWAQAACWSLSRLGTPFILTLHGGLLPELGRRRPQQLKRLLASAARVTVPSMYLLEQMERFRGDLVLLPNPLTLEAYPFRLRSRLEPRLIWIRAFHEVYNPSLAPRVLRRLLVDYPGATLIMIGPDKGDGSLTKARQVARELEVDHRVEWFADGVPKGQVPRHLSKADIFINTTNVDNAPVTVQEAQACGLCVVSTNVGGLPDLLSNEEDALLVERDAPEEMASAVSRLLCEAELSARLSAAGRHRVEACDWSKLLPKWESLLLEVQ